MRGLLSHAALVSLLVPVVAHADRPLLEEEAYRHLVKDRFAQALTATEQGLAIRPQVPVSWDEIAVTGP